MFSDYYIYKIMVVMACSLIQTGVTLSSVVTNCKTLVWEAPSNAISMGFFCIKVYSHSMVKIVVLLNTTEITYIHNIYIFKIPTGLLHSVVLSHSLL